MSRTQYSRSLALLAATAFAASAAPLLAATEASATTGAGCSSATIQYRLEGGDWTSTGGFRTWNSGLDKVEVRLAPGQQVGADCKYPVSLAEYTTEGPSWATSGKQTLVEKATVYLGKDDVAGQDDSGRTWQKLNVKTPDCYGQIDLYGDDVTYDGGTGEGHGPAPYQPGNVVTPNHLIAAWNGGDKECAPTTPSTPPAPSTPPSTPPAGETTPPPATETTPPAAPPTTPVSETPPTTPDVPPLASTPPATPTPTPSPSESTPPLAETGSSTPVGPIAGGAAAVVVIGAGAVFFANRSRKKGAAE
ncbi:LAETG motif-containing sortase-dependent surface protein [Streptomyces sp. ST1015]|uniref:LAETG motif-containing sortase-dependent surface protein n=1 Tax=unclassified Streptomyces TaxID=2593676 RepID=UPI001CA69F38|nr:LAETG motif-containing sortase-dependent surface protein [Streptomyces sp. ST1015]QZZ25854.1 hypothetical protein A7X85_05980 [Streptomyces sp. ST1015]